MTPDNQHTTTITLEQLLHGVLPAGGQELISLIDDGEPRDSVSSLSQDVNSAGGRLT
jgi:hypothetical protein